MARRKEEMRYPRERGMGSLILQGLGVWMMASGAIFLLLVIFGAE